ncbi:Smr/MutS family protein [Longimicrobium sp.]|uniref:Smr/MutS family protein n=1 Tax=Longimicrobium sp. TaxID=2029185 RepID=UPI002B50B8F9|nr:Smr/MutS family protein [Longimicrobium sp.]HSU14206.1 Smr/MutS family protein [Longimicrobium sp.]
MARRRRPSEPSRGTIYPLLDLHGHTGGEARARTESWLRARAAGGERTVVIVTGRGNRSQGLPVLRGEVEHLLTLLTGEVVLRWEMTVGGGGFRVELRPARETVARADDGRLLRDHSHALRRQAEEALIELGITPTPPLVLAEIRRILAEEEG